MGTNELAKVLRKRVKKDYGIVVTKKQIKAVLNALRDVSYDECKNGGSITIRGFLRIRGELTKSTKLPNGLYSIPRMKITVSLSSVMVENFKLDVTGRLDNLDDYIDEEDWDI